MHTLYISVSAQLCMSMFNKLRVNVEHSFLAAKHLAMLLCVVVEAMYQNCQSLGVIKISFKFRKGLGSLSETLFICNCSTSISQEDALLLSSLPQLIL